ncbi:MAG: putative inorganic carbon transporter subunit DabA [Myxococcota bacterium]
MESFAEPFLQEQESLPIEGEEQSAPSTAERVESACASVPPLWPLRHFVAVNPYLGLTDRPFEDALAYAERTFDAPAFMDDDYFQRAYREGRFDHADLQAAARFSGDGPAEDAFVPTATDVLAATGGGALESVVVDEISRWCAGRFDEGQATWKQPGRARPTFEAWLAHARIDRSPELNGIPDFRRFVASLPEDPLATIERLMDRLGVPEAARVDYLTRLLGSVLGWAGHAQYRRREARLRGGEDDALVALFPAKDED